MSLTASSHTPPAALDLTLKNTSGQNFLDLALARFLVKPFLELAQFIVLAAEKCQGHPELARPIGPSGRPLKEWLPALKHWIQLELLKPVRFMSLYFWILIIYTMNRWDQPRFRLLALLLFPTLDISSRNQSSQVAGTNPLSLRMRSIWSAPALSQFPN